MHLPRYTARVSIVVASLVVVTSVLYKNYKESTNQRVIVNYLGKKEISEFSNPRDLKSSSDELPLCERFYREVCRGQEIVNDPTGSVQPDVKGEVEALRLYEKIIHEHPDWGNEAIDDELVRIIYTPKRQQMLREIFSWVQSRMIRIIEKQSKANFSKGDKEALISRVKKISLEIPPPASIYANEPDLFTKNDVYYETISSEKRIIRVGGAYLLSAKSWFNRVFTIAHEMAHSIDPCELKEAGKITGYQNLTECFKDAGILSSSQLENGCASNFFVGEVFADWMSTEITAEALQIYLKKFKDPKQVTNSLINSVKDLCLQESWLVQDLNSHPLPKIRIEKIFAAHPVIQELLGCSAESQEKYYCSFKGKIDVR